MKTTNQKATKIDVPVIVMVRVTIAGNAPAESVEDEGQRAVIRYLEDYQSLPSRHNEWVGNKCIGFDTVFDGGGFDYILESPEVRTELVDMGASGFHSGSLSSWEDLECYTRRKAGVESND